MKWLDILCVILSPVVAFGFLIKYRSSLNKASTWLPNAWPKFWPDLVTVVVALMLALVCIYSSFGLVTILYIAPLEMFGVKPHIGVAALGWILLSTMSVFLLAADWARMFHKRLTEWLVVHRLNRNLKGKTIVWSEKKED